MAQIFPVCYPWFSPWRQENWSEELSWRGCCKPDPPLSWIWTQLGCTAKCGSWETFLGSKWAKWAGAFSYSLVIFKQFKTNKDITSLHRSIHSTLHKAILRYHCNFKAKNHNIFVSDSGQWITECHWFGRDLQGSLSPTSGPEQDNPKDHAICLRTLSNHLLKLKQTWWLSSLAPSCPVVATIQILKDPWLLTRKRRGGVCCMETPNELFQEL